MRCTKYLISPDQNNIEIKRWNSSLHSSKAHLHDELSIALMEKGNFVEELHGKSYLMKDRSILIIPAKVVHKCRPADLENWNFRMVYVNKEWIEKIFNIGCNEIKFLYKELDDENYCKVKKVFDVIDNFKNNIKSESEMIEHISTILFSQYDEYKKVTSSVQDIKILKDIKEFIEMNYRENLMLQDFVNISGLSKYYIIRKFEHKYGTSPHQYLTSLRINHATKIMKKNVNISEVAVESGFYDQAHFTKTFKEYTGITPMKYLNDIS